MKGYVHIYCGDGKGKTTAAVGLAVRAAGRGKKVLIARFLKTDDSGEVPVLGDIPGITVIPCKKTFGFYFQMTEEQKEEAALYYGGLFRTTAARAVEESTAYQTREVLEAMNADSGHALTELKVDGGMTRDELLMQFQADQVGVPVVRPKVAETTALGAAYASGIAVGFWSGTQDVIDNWAEDKRWEPTMEEAERERLFRNWNKAVQRTLDWVDEDVVE